MHRNNYRSLQQHREQRHPQHQPEEQEQEVELTNLLWQEEVSGT